MFGFKEVVRSWVSSLFGAFILALVIYQVAARHASWSDALIALQLATGVGALFFNDDVICKSVKGGAMVLCGLLLFSCNSHKLVSRQVATDSTVIVNTARIDTSYTKIDSTVVTYRIECLPSNGIYQPVVRHVWRSIADRPVIARQRYAVGKDTAGIDLNVTALCDSQAIYNVVRSRYVERHRARDSLQEVVITAPKSIRQQVEDVAVLALVFGGGFAVAEVRREVLRWRM